ncbi:hypothetical protein E2F49_11600 [Luteimonas terrae]|uniref:Uncharacterized protein n=2 Tax=Luteimonas terrae TaxID=1530191 RepID=A0A4R5U9C3_9GAMM|nr:hypothetical protein E2F49_11600 [Luteimonas terrae]
MITLTDDEKPKFERMVEDAMRAFGYSRAKAETMAGKMVERFRKLGYFPGDKKAGPLEPQKRVAVARPLRAKRAETERQKSRGLAPAAVPKRAATKATPQPAQAQPAHSPMSATEKAYYDRLVIDGMKRRYCRSKAEKLARAAVRRYRKTGVMAGPKAIIPKKPRTPVKLTRAEIAKLPPAVPPRPPPRNAKERMERALGPDEGERRRRGGSPVLQGGSPGLGKRR